MKKLIAAIVILVMLTPGCLDVKDKNTSHTQEDVFWGLKFRKTYEKEDITVLRHDSNGTRVDLKVIRGLSQENADRYVSDSLLMLESVFNERRSGYPGQLTRSIECPTKYKPEYREKEVDGGRLGYYIGYANQNYVAGACSEDLIAFRSMNGFAYCPGEKTLFEIDFFTPKDSQEIEDFIKKIRC
ncbi:MAG: hypothetical protein ABIH11_03060 [Candidatus Altiarchaeota archaeon]